MRSKVSELENFFSTNYEIVGKEFKEDLLGREADIRVIFFKIFKMLKNPELHGKTLSVEGDWGSGKSYVKNYVYNILTKGKIEHSLELIKFNPWKIKSTNKNSNELLYELLLKIRKHNRIEEDDQKRKNVLFKNFEVALILSFGFFIFELFKIIFLGRVRKIANSYLTSECLYWLGGIISLAVAISILYTVYSILVKRASLAEESDKNDFTLFEEINKSLKLNKRYVLFVDDIDRLSSEDTYRVLSIINLLAENTSIIVVAFFDRDKILLGENAYFRNGFLDRCFSNNHNISPINKFKFIKIISDRIENYLQMNFSKKEKSKFDENSENFFLILGNLRGMNRYIGSVENVMEQIGEDRLNDLFKTDLLLLELLRISNNRLYKKIRRNGKALVSNETLSIYGIQMLNVEEINEQVSNFLDGDIILSEMDKDLMRELFPLFKIAENMRFADLKKWFEANYDLHRVGDYRYFKDYFPENLSVETPTKSEIAKKIFEINYTDKQSKVLPKVEDIVNEYLGLDDYTYVFNTISSKNDYFLNFENKNRSMALKQFALKVIELSPKFVLQDDRVIKNLDFILETLNINQYDFNELENDLNGMVNSYSTLQVIREMHDRINIDKRDLVRPLNALKMREIFINSDGLNELLNRERPFWDFMGNYFLLPAVDKVTFKNDFFEKYFVNLEELASLIFKNTDDDDYRSIMDLHVDYLNEFFKENMEVLKNVLNYESPNINKYKEFKEALLKRFFVD